MILQHLVKRWVIITLMYSNTRRFTPFHQIIGTFIFTEYYGYSNPVSFLMGNNPQHTCTVPGGRLYWIDLLVGICSLECTN